MCYSNNTLLRWRWKEEELETDEEQVKWVWQAHLKLQRSRQLTEEQVKNKTNKHREAEQMNTS